MVKGKCLRFWLRIPFLSLRPRPSVSITHQLVGTLESRTTGSRPKRGDGVGHRDRRRSCSGEVSQDIVEVSIRPVTEELFPHFLYLSVRSVLLRRRR